MVAGDNRLGDSFGVIGEVTSFDVTLVGSRDYGCGSRIPCLFV